jgi:hypothetical protein
MIDGHTQLVGLLGWHPPGWLASPLAHGINTVFAIASGVVAVALPVLGATLAPMSTIDLAYQVRAGDLMLSARDVLRSDPFTFTAAGAPWVDQQWGAQVFFAVVHGIVTAHGGTIQVDSQIGRGSRFEVRFPASAARDPAAEQQQ